MARLDPLAPVSEVGSRGDQDYQAVSAWFFLHSFCCQTGCAKIWYMIYWYQTYDILIYTSDIHWLISWYDFHWEGRFPRPHPIWSFSRRPQKSSWASVAGRAPKTAFSALGNGPHWGVLFFRNHTKMVGCCEGWDSSDHLGFRWAIFQTTHLHTTWTLDTDMATMAFLHARARVRCLCSVGMMVFNKLSVVHFPAVPGDPFSLDGDALDVGWNTIPSWEKRREGGSNPISPPSGKHTKNYGKSPFLMGKIHYKSPFSIAFCIVYQRVIWNALKMVPNMSKSPTSTMLAAEVFNMRGKESPRRMGEMNFDCDQCSGNPCQPSGWPRGYGGPEW